MRFFETLLAFIIIASIPAWAQSPLSAKFFGTTTLVLEDGETAIMIDGFFSRPSLTELMHRLNPKKENIARILTDANITNLAAVLVSHSHYDHAMDAPTVASLTGADIVGSASSAQIARAEGFPQQRFKPIAGNGEFQYGKFTIQVVRSLHSPHRFLSGEIDDHFQSPARFYEYKEGGSFSFLISHAGRRILVHPSANFVTGMYAGIKVDLAFVAIGTLGKQSALFQENFWNEIIVETQVPLLIPVHWDNFFKPISEPLEPMPYPFDAFEAAQSFLNEKATDAGVSILWPQAGETMQVLP